MKIAICPGSFDPVTKGHVDIIKRASAMFDYVIIAVMVNPNKTPSFTTEERIRLLGLAIPDLSNIEIVSFDGLLADYARKRGAVAIVKGLRNMYLSSSMVKQISRFGGDISSFVPECIHKEIKDRLCDRRS